ncbi:hypothetical protein PR048_020956 [Dryococelus australis]|uniref:Reverse transcriptase domain-containing protein n=1 Tax=Dryococelus australis TaxID=614101 RepID=A0ABQ9GWV7_9NEOP|nr:hypothetical protein PR048_020956 [Dryococelus australis]
MAPWAAEHWDALEDLCGDLASAVYAETASRGKNGAHTLPSLVPVQGMAHHKNIQATAEHAVNQDITIRSTDVRHPVLGSTKKRPLPYSACTGRTPRRRCRPLPRHLRERGLRGRPHPVWHGAPGACTHRGGLRGNPATHHRCRDRCPSQPHGEHGPGIRWGALPPSAERRSKMLGDGGAVRGAPAPWRVPQLWKDSVTFLVNKDGDRDDPANWRPIALSPTLAKLYLGVLADRLGKWAAQTGRISRQQKGFQEFEGCLEHNFVLQAAIEDSRHRRQPPTPQTAGGSMARLRECFRHADAHPGGPHGADTNRGWCEQGCPLSPVLFNLGMEPLIRCLARQAEDRGYQLAGQHHTVLAYADDLAVLARSPQDLQALSDTATRARGGHPTAMPTTIHIDEMPIRALAEGEGYRHLGVPTGYRAAHTPEDIQRLRADIARIDQNLLAPWQKIDATRVFLLSWMQFILRGGRVRKTALAAFDRDVQALVKRWLNLPHRATPLMAHVPRTNGGAGILSLGDLCDTNSIAHAFRILSCKDPNISELAWAQLGQRRRTRRECMAPAARYLRRHVVVEPDVPRAPAGHPHARRQGTGLCPSGTPTAPSGLHAPQRCDEDALQENVRHLPDQGKVLDASSRDPASSHYMLVGKYTRFAEWRFVHRARLNGAHRGRGQHDRRCGRCGYQTETLAHVLNHCRIHSAAWQWRHNAIVERHQRAAQLDLGTQLRVNQQVPHTPPCSGRPGLAERDLPDRTPRRRDRTLRQQVVLDQLRMRCFQAEVEAIVVGLLGSWDTANDKVLHRLQNGWRYSILMRRLIVRDCVRWSHAPADHQAPPPDAGNPPPPHDPPQQGAPYMNQQRNTDHGAAAEAPCRPSHTDYRTAPTNTENNPTGARLQRGNQTIRTSTWYGQARGIRRTNPRDAHHDALPNNQGPARQTEDQRANYQPGAPAPGHHVMGRWL